jgi:hypothetical protein
MKVSKRFPKNTTTFSWYAAMAVVIKNVLIVGCWMLDVGCWNSFILDNSNNDEEDQNNQVHGDEIPGG